LEPEPQYPAPRIHNSAKKCQHCVLLRREILLHGELANQKKRNVVEFSIPSNIFEMFQQARFKSGLLLKTLVAIEERVW
jgi:hypothetical protein